MFLKVHTCTIHHYPLSHPSISAKSEKAPPAHFPLSKFGHQPHLGFSQGFWRGNQCVLSHQSLPSSFDQMITSSLSPHQSLLHQRCWDNKPMNALFCLFEDYLFLLSWFREVCLATNSFSFKFLWSFFGLLNRLINGKPWFPSLFFLLRRLSAWKYYIPTE